MTDWTSVANNVAQIVTVLAPFAKAAAPGSAAAIDIATKVIQGVIAAEPTAIALYNSIKNGAVPTPEELKQFSGAYEASYQKLKADIAAKLAALPPG